MHGEAPLPSSPDTAKNDAPAAPIPAAPAGAATASRCSGATAAASRRAAAAPAPAAAPDKTSEAAPSPAAAPNADDAAGKITAELSQQQPGGDLKLSFAFKMPVGAAVFHRADTLWIVFDSKAAIDLSALEGEPSRTIRSYEFSQSGDADIVRLKLDRPRLSSVAADGAAWTLDIGDTVLSPTHALDITRNVIGPNRSSVSITFDNAQSTRSPIPTSATSCSSSPRSSGARPDRRAGFHRIPRAGLDPGRGDRATWPTTSPSSVVPDKIVVTRPLGLTLVDLDADLDARFGAAHGDIRLRKPGAPIAQGAVFRAPGATHRRRRRGAAASSVCCRGSNWRASISRAACIRRPRACSTWRLMTSAVRPRALAAIVLRAVAEDHDGPPRRRAQGFGHARRSAISMTRRCGGRSLMRGRAAGRRPGKPSRPWRRRWRRCRSSCSASRSRTKCAPRSRSATSTAPPTISTISRPSAPARDGADDRRLDGAARRGASAAREDALAAYRMAADSLGPAGGGARHLARGRAALPARRPQARRRHFASSNC